MEYSRARLEKQGSWITFHTRQIPKSYAPRGSYSYEEDILSIHRAHELIPTIRQCLQQTLPLSQTPTIKSLDVAIVGVLGDTVLNSAAWLSGSTLTGIDLYDTVLVVVDAAGHKIAIPAVRALSGSSLQKIFAATRKDPEQAIPKFRGERGHPNAGYGLTWIYWIPCTSDRWLQLASDHMKFLGTRKAEVMTDQDVTAHLDSPEINISFHSVQDVKDVLAFSRKATDIFLSLL